MCLVLGIRYACCEKVFEDLESPVGTQRKLRIKFKCISIRRRSCQHFNLEMDPNFYAYRFTRRCPRSERLRTAETTENVEEVRQSFLLSAQRCAIRNSFFTRLWWYRNCFSVIFKITFLVSKVVGGHSRKCCCVVQ